LELAFWINAVVTGARPEKAQSVGIDGLGYTVVLERLAKVEKVVPGRVGGNKTARQVEAGMVVNSEQESLFTLSRPPLLDGAVVLPEFADGCAAEAPVDALFTRRKDNQVGEVEFDVCLNGGTSAFESAKAFQLVGDKLEVGRVLHGQKAFEEVVNFGGPETATAASAGF